MKKEKQCSCEKTRLVSFEEHIERGEVEFSSMTRKCVDCGEVSSITYTPADVKAIQRKYGNTEFKNMLKYLASKKKKLVSMVEASD